MRERGGDDGSSIAAGAGGSGGGERAPRRRPLLVYDGDCGFCTSSVRAAQRYLDPPVEMLPYQYSQLTGATLERAKDEVLLVHPDGKRVWGGADAAAILLLASPHRWAWPAGWLLRLPGGRAAGAAVYDLVARNRHRLPGGTPTCQMGPA
ncbi:putative DCC family thiol-disulfide oxidoreductase YuxK [Lipingzhangella halophila]|uniref:Putative DCC family thiol-disulfide oxidoreductase YuxK n=1 Tax=Lipingzhangella halophila TaxID=1783352 RepID=A0A7W7RIF2_9ACTN|nr:DCC1-like thiol-disulfide oxidoreductase family protein [Lipingzhangella halophila]MBB4932553.1 putative DCC family thiol-disulfide oxidoreductase YuxK [Lipingzhangella halophila]